MFLLAAPIAKATIQPECQTVDYMLYLYILLRAKVPFNRCHIPGCLYNFTLISC